MDLAFIKVVGQTLVAVIWSLQISHLVITTGTVYFAGKFEDSEKMDSTNRGKVGRLNDANISRRAKERMDLLYSSVFYTLLLFFLNR